MFERFTDRARRVVVIAQAESRLLGHDYIGTEHLLLGLVGESDGVAARALAALDVDLDVVRARVEGMIGRGPGRATGHIPFTPRAKKVLEMSLREALQMGHNYIGTEHILLGVLREGEGVACQVLMNEGVTLAVARQEVIGLLATLSGEELEGVEGSPQRSPSAMLESSSPAERAAAVERLSAGGRPSASDARLRRREGEPERTPVCPRCETDLTASLRSRVQDVPDGIDAEAPPRRAALLYCAECGRVVAANLLDSELDQADLDHSDPTGDAGEGVSTANEAAGAGEPDPASETG